MRSVKTTCENRVVEDYQLLDDAQEGFRRHRSIARARDLGVSVLKSDGIGKDIDCPLDFGPYLLASQDRGMTRSFLDQINIAERFGVEDAPAPVRLF